MKKEKMLGILSIFLTIDGEANKWGQGGFTTFVRTRGCTVGCHWCDTKYSWGNKGGKDFLPWELVEAVKLYSKGCRKVTITGGEPLEQDWEAIKNFILLLLATGFKVSMETSGTQNTVDFREYLFKEQKHLRNRSDLCFVVDYKLLFSEYIGTRMDIPGHFSKLHPNDIVKFVVSSNQDFEEAVGAVKLMQTYPTFRSKMYFSPTHGEMSAGNLMQRMIDAGMPAHGVGLNIQAHKYIFDADNRDEEDFLGVDYTKRSMGRANFLESTRDHEE